MVLVGDAKSLGCGGCSKQANYGEWERIPARNSRKSKSQSKGVSDGAHVASRLARSPLHRLLVLRHRWHSDRLLFPDAVGHPCSLCDFAAVADVASAHSLAQLREFVQLVGIQLFCVSPKDLGSGLHVGKSEVQLQIEPTQESLEDHEPHPIRTASKSCLRFVAQIRMLRFVFTSSLFMLELSNPSRKRRSVDRSRRVTSFMLSLSRLVTRLSIWGG